MTLTARNLVINYPMFINLQHINLQCFAVAGDL